jgi:chromosome segregation protein
VNEPQDQGAHFFRCDLQIHTPRDSNWDGGGAVTDDERRQYAKEFVDACRGKGLQAVAITDHHDVVFFKYIKEAALQETDKSGQPLDPSDRLTVFAGVELTLGIPCQALLIFDADLPVEFLPSALSALGITPSDAAAAKTAATKKLEFMSFEDLYKTLNKLDSLRDHFIVFPHFSDGGHKSLLRKDFEKHYISMPCVGGYVDGSLPVDDNKSKGWRSITSGLDKNWGNKTIGMFQTSDSRSRSHAKLGTHATWIKWAIPTAEALRQACLAQNSRISQEAPQLPAVVIRSIHVSNSEFLGPLDLRLNPQYTALIGSRGTGKSTILEYLRWGLCDEHDPEDADGMESVGVRQQRLVDNTLKKYSATVEVRFEVNGVPHLVRRRSATGEILLKIGEAELQPCTKEDIRTLLPIEAYSQKQLSRVGHRVDDLNDFVRSGIKTELDSLDGQVRSLISQSRQVYSQLRRKQTIEKALREDKLSIQSLSQQAQNIRDSLTGLTLEQQLMLSKQPAYLEAELQVEKWDGEIRDVRKTISNLSQRLATIPSAPKSPLDAHPELDTLGKINNLIKTSADALATFSAQMGDIVGQLIDVEGGKTGEYRVAHEQWAAAKKVFDDAYRAAKSAASSHESQLRALEDLEQKIRTISHRISVAENEIGALGDPEIAFKRIRSEWKELHKRKGDLYAGQCAELTKLSDGVIRATARRGANVEALDAQLRSITKGSGLRGQKIEDMLQQICVASDPVALWDGLLDELEKLAHHTPGDQIAAKPATPSLVQVGLGDSDLAKLAEKISPENWLELALTSLDDKTTFEYQTKEQEYIPFENASAGQQATALLMTLLNQAGPPLVIDQPEDDLDNQIIFEIVKRVWKAKTRRQLIFSSHNANLVVNGDSELVVWCDYRVAGDFSRGQIASEGAIDIPKIREIIKSIMEGGEKAFKLRLDKYGF